jgi:hypothetical protein
MLPNTTDSNHQNDLIPQDPTWKHTLTLITALLLAPLATLAAVDTKVPHKGIDQ